MHSFLLRYVLPSLIAVQPALAGGLIFAALPVDARHDYLDRLMRSPFDWLIISAGLLFFLAQTWLAWKALRWMGSDFDQRPDKWLGHLSQAAEWFPLLGLIGTVAAILQTFGSIMPGSTPTPQDIIRKYAPAITATGSGLFMALLNILPAWVVTTGRDFLRHLIGQPIDAPLPIVPLTPANTSEHVP